MGRLLKITIQALTLASLCLPAFGQIDTPDWLAGVAVPGTEGSTNHGLRIEINIPAYQLTVYEHNQVVGRYEIAVGSTRHPSPRMSNKSIGRIEWNPSWYPPNSPWAKGASIAKPGPNNPLGAVKMPIANGILVHGTNKPHTIGTAASHGCFRMRSEEAVVLAWYLQERASSKTDPELFEQYQANRYRTRVVNFDSNVPTDIVYETVQIQGGDLHVYPDVYGRAGSLQDELVAAFTKYGYNTDAITPELIASLKSQLSEGPVQVALSDSAKPFQYATQF